MSLLVHGLDQSGDLRGARRRFTPCEGILRPLASLDERVVAGESIAAINDLTFGHSTTVYAPSDGVIGILKLAANVALGQLIATIFHPIAAPSATNAPVLESRDGDGA